MATYESYCIQAFTVATTGYTPAVMTDFLSWGPDAFSSPPGHSWAVVGSAVEFDTNLLGLNVRSNNWITSYAFEVGRTYSFAYEFQGSGCETFHIDISDISGNTLTGFTVSPVDATPVSGTYEVMAPIGAVGISIWMFSACSCGGGLCVKSILNFENLTVAEGDQDPYAITEEICIDILEQCEAQQGFTQEDARLLEDGDFRLLE